MTLHIENFESTEIEWTIRLAPQTLTDIIVQVVKGQEKLDDSFDTTFAFNLGDLLRSFVDDRANTIGEFCATRGERDFVLRVAKLLEAYAAILRAGVEPFLEEKGDRMAMSKAQARKLAKAIKDQAGRAV